MQARPFNDGLAEAITITFSIGKWPPVTMQGRAPGRKHQQKGSTMKTLFVLLAQFDGQPSFRWRGSVATTSYTSPPKCFNKRCWLDKIHPNYSIRTKPKERKGNSNHGPNLDAQCAAPIKESNQLNSAPARKLTYFNVLARSFTDVRRILSSNFKPHRYLRDRTDVYNGAWNSNPCVLTRWRLGEHPSPSQIVG